MTAVTTGIMLVMAWLTWSDGANDRRPVERVGIASVDGDESPSSIERRAEAIRRGAPAIDESSARELMNESDAIIATLDAEGVGHHVGHRGRHIRRELEQMQVTDEELLAYYEAHRDVFGSRSFESSRVSLERLTRIHKLRAQLTGSGEAAGRPGLCDDGSAGEGAP